MHLPQPLKILKGSIWQQNSLTMLFCNWTADLKMIFLCATKDFQWFLLFCWLRNPFERIFCNHCRQNIPYYAGLPAKSFCCGKACGRGKMIEDSIDATLEQIDKGAYVNIYTILQILITIPISSASCDRSISTLQNLKTYLKSTKVQDRLHGLALMHAHREMELDLEKIIDLFANLHPRRMRIENILN